MSNVGPDAGWYPDPTRPGTERWWGGSGWSDSVRPIGSVAPVPPGPTASAVYGVQPLAQGPGKRRGGCFGIATGVMFGILGAIVLLIGGCAALLVAAGDTSNETSFATVPNEGSQTTATATSSANESPTSATQAVETSEGSTTAGESAAETVPTLDLTPPQQNAVRSAESYLDFSSFSRQGLIDQLSSEFGDQFAVEDATVAVDSLNADWNEQAAESALSYLDLSGFSCQGLIDQLSSEFGSQFTVEQATYGANQAGAC